MADPVLRCLEEPRNFVQQAPMTRFQQVASLTKIAICIGCCIFILTTVKGQGKTHFGSISGNVEMIEQRGEIGVILFIVNDEPPYPPRQGPSGVENINRIGMASQLGFRFKNCYLVPFRQQPCGG